MRRQGSACSPMIPKARGYRGRSHRESSPNLPIRVTGGCRSMAGLGAPLVTRHRYQTAVFAVVRCPSVCQRAPGRQAAAISPNRDEWRVSRRAAIVSKLAEALASAHQQGAVHRDLRDGSSTSNPTRQKTFDLGQDRFLLGKLARLQFGIEQAPVGDQLEAAAAGRDQFQALDALFESGQQLARQTDGLRFVVSHRAVLQFQVHDQAPFLQAISKG